MELQVNNYGDNSYLKPYTYPYYIWIGIIIIAGLSIYSLTEFPKFYEAASYYKKAERLSNVGNDVEAVQLYYKALQLTPTAKNIKFAMGYSIFKEPRYRDKSRALDYLQGVSLDSGQWAKLQKVMPNDYQKYFVTKKR